MRCNVFNLTSNNSLSKYQKVWKYQKLLAEHLYQIKKDVEKSKVNPSLNFDSIVIVEHPSIYTLGRGSTLENVKFNIGDNSLQHELVRVERGGEITWHGPGQLVAYPIFDLNNHKRDLHWYLLL